MNRCLPSECEMLALSVDVLPGNSSSPVYPFQSVVINFNVHTRGHRDPQDQMICLVMPIGSFEGGELCMAETGLVVGLRSGDWMIFRSAQVTHFNLHFRGTRASLVMHTDRAMVGWVDDCNGWLNHSAFN